MQYQSLPRAHRAQPSPFPTAFLKAAPQSALSNPKSPYAGLTQAQLRQIVLEQLG